MAVNFVRMDLDGTTAERVTNISPSGGSYPSYLAEANGRLYFAANPRYDIYNYFTYNMENYELWSTSEDGSDIGRVNGLLPDSAVRWPTDLHAAGDSLYLSGLDSQNGREL